MISPAAIDMMFQAVAPPVMNQPTCGAPDAVVAGDRFAEQWAAAMASGQQGVTPADAAARPAPRQPDGGAKSSEMEISLSGDGALTAPPPCTAERIMTDQLTVKSVEGTDDADNTVADASDVSASHGTPPAAGATLDAAICAPAALPLQPAREIGAGPSEKLEAMEPPSLVSAGPKIDPGTDALRDAALLVAAGDPHKAPEARFALFALPLGGPSPDDHAPAMVGAGMSPIDLQNRNWTGMVASAIGDSGAADGLLSLRLTPDHLGALEISVIKTATGLAIELRTGDEAAEQLIRADEPRLLEEFRQKGILLSEYSLRNGASDDSRRHHSGANAQPYLPWNHAESETAQTRDQTMAPMRGRFA